MTAVRDTWIPPVDKPAFREGVRAMMPMSLAITVWGVVTGVAMANQGMSVPIGLLMTFTVFAGSAQLAVLPLLAVRAPLPVVWATALVVNLRFVIFAASSRRSFVDLTLRQRILAGYLNGDLGFALFSQRFADDPDRGSPVQWGYFYGGALVNWVVWQAASVAGIVLGGFAPEEWGLELAAYLALTAVLVPMCVKFPAIAGVAVAIVVSVVTVDLPMRLGLLVAVVAGVTVAMLAEHLHGRHARRRESTI
ncbi:MAG: AzlC family ABC transporter permease [Actinobacteria bacterium]|nr:AzlC family ABC transporter permease [Actinomycetota bacterium]